MSPGELLPGEPIVWMDGRIAPEREATVCAADRGFVYGDGLFETVRTHGRRAFRLCRHLARLREGARVVSIAVPDVIDGAVLELLEQGGFGEGALRITLTRGIGAEGLRPRVARQPTLVVSLRAAPVFEPEAPLSVTVSDLRVCSHGALAGLKTLGYLPNILALARAAAEDVVMLDEAGRLAQASAANLFWVSASGELRTPSRACGILPGITREAVLELAGSTGIRTAEGEWGLDELERAREAFTTSSLRGIAAITSLDATRIGDGTVGPVTKALQAAYADLFRRETA